MNKNNKSKLLILAIISVLVLASFTVKAAADEGGITIGIVQYVEHQSLDDARDGFIAALAENGYQDNNQIRIDYQNAQGDLSNLSTIGDRFVAKKVDLILAIATPAAQSMAAKTVTIPILGTAITDYEVARLVESNTAPGGNVSGTTDMNPIKEQIELLIRLAPKAKTIGVLYTSSEDNSILQAEIAKEIIQNLGLVYKEITISNSNEVQQSVQSMVNQADAIYIPTDNIFAATMPVVYGVTSQSKTPVVCGAAAMVIDGGLATLGINYYDLGYQTGLMAIRILTGESEPATMPIESATGFDFTINGNVAEEIQVKIPDDLKEYISWAE